MHYQPSNLIEMNANGTNPFLNRLESARAAGAVMAYEYKNLKPRKQLKEIIGILKPEMKRFLKIPYRFKYNMKDRCVVCGTHKIWDGGDAMRPPLPLHKVRKGYPMRGTYCEKHAAVHRQYEMLEQQILAEEHGLSFSAYVPSVKTLNPLSSSPLTTLKQGDIQSLSALGWVIRPPQMSTTSKEEELFRLLIESEAVSSRMKALLTEGVVVQDVEADATIETEEA
tara:strand:- start:121 stop:795 length:675 start_codon:yes stop_codon:yes gene_type:complete